MKKNTSYLQKFDSIIKDISTDNDLSEEDCKELIDFFFQTFKSFLTDTRMPQIKISNLGTFKPSLGKIDWQIGNAEMHIRNDQQPLERFKSKVNYLSIIKERLIAEANGEETWKEWRNKKLKKDAKE